MFSSKVSVVIPSLGEKQLENTLIHLNNGTIIPDEILICIPKSYAPKFDCHKFHNLKFVFTEKMGQVKQRIEGFKLAKNKYILQMDSDLVLEKNCLHLPLISFLILLNLLSCIDSYRKRIISNLVFGSGI